jgi:UDP-arabinose 4-epimerase
VTDLARAHVLALDHLISGGPNLAVNLGTGRGASIAEILKAIGHITKREVPVEMQPRRAGDPPALYADPAFAQRVLGFSPEYSDLDTIIRTAAPFFGLRAQT